MRNTCGAKERESKEAGEEAEEQVVFDAAWKADHLEDCDQPDNGDRNDVHYEPQLEAALHVRQPWNRVPFCDGHAVYPCAVGVVELEQIGGRLKVYIPQQGFHVENTTQQRPDGVGDADKAEYQHSDGAASRGRSLRRTVLLHNHLTRHRLTLLNRVLLLLLLLLVVLRLPLR